MNALGTLSASFMLRARQCHQAFPLVDGQAESDESHAKPDPHADLLAVERTAQQQRDERRGQTAHELIVAVGEELHRVTTQDAARGEIIVTMPPARSTP